MAVMAASDRLTFGGFLARLAFALLVAGATYNPTGYSFYHWARSTGFAWSPQDVFTVLPSAFALAFVS